MDISVTPGTGVTCTLAYEGDTPLDIALQVSAARRPGVRMSERLDIRGDSVALTARELIGPHGGRQHLVHAPPGPLTVDYRATVATDPAPPARVTDEERLTALLPSRYCPSDRLAGFARSAFGDRPTPLDRVRAICDHVWRNIAYEAGASGPGTDAVDTLMAGSGVCRDFAHVVAALCRAVQVPARVAAVFAPGLSPMDFHLVVETDIDGAWQVWDATRLAPRPALIRIATGRDAADVAFATIVSGRAEMRGMEILAVAGGDLPNDDHERLVALG